MARIRSLSPAQGEPKPHPTEVDCTWQVLRDGAGGSTLFQISTYGSDTRASEPKVSQTIQVDRAVARQLVEALSQAFDL